jgi:hypothetical protein
MMSKVINWFNGLKLAWRLCIAGVTLVIIPVALAWGLFAGMLLLGVFLLLAGFATATQDI